jgi:hypothetical protein
MKSAALISLIAHTFTTPVEKVSMFARLLREAGLITTGARGRNAPEMTALDAARLTIALLTTDSPSECVERVKRFGQIKYTPDYKTNFRDREVVTAAQFRALFKGETLEEVVAYIFALPTTIGLEAALQWYDRNVFHLRVSDFRVLAELFKYKMDGGEIVGEIVVPFKGKVYVRNGDDLAPVSEFPVIKGGVVTERSISAIQFAAVGIPLGIPATKSPEAD